MAALRAVGARAEVGFDPARLDGVRTVVASSAIRADNPRAGAGPARPAPRCCTAPRRCSRCCSGTARSRWPGPTARPPRPRCSPCCSSTPASTPRSPWVASWWGRGRTGTRAAVRSSSLRPTSPTPPSSSTPPRSRSSPTSRPITSTTTARPRRWSRRSSGSPTASATTARWSACADDPGSAALARRSQELGRRVLTYGTDPTSTVQVHDVRFVEGRSRFVLLDTTLGRGAHREGASPDAGPTTEVWLQVPGHHNVLNAAGAYIAARALGVPGGAAREGLAAFTGTRRRFECRGEVGGVRVYDDYAHNPAKVAAAVATGRRWPAPAGCSWSSSRTCTAGRCPSPPSSAAALSGADEVVVMDVYAAREDAVPGVTGALVADRVDLPAEQVAYLPSWSAVAGRGRGPGPRRRPGPDGRRRRRDDGRPRGAGPARAAHPRPGRRGGGPVSPRPTQPVRRTAPATAPDHAPSAPAPHPPGPRRAAQAEPARADRRSAPEVAHRPGRDARRRAHRRAAPRESAPPPTGRSEAGAPRRIGAPATRPAGACGTDVAPPLRRRAGRAPPRRAPPRATGRSTTGSTTRSASAPGGPCRRRPARPGRHRHRRDPVALAPVTAAPRRCTRSTGPGSRTARSVGSPSAPGATAGSPGVRWPWSRAWSRCSS